MAVIHARTPTFPSPGRPAPNRPANSRADRLLMLLIGCCASLIPMLPQAQDNAEPVADRRPWYQVELLIFAQPGYNQNAEAWDSDLRPNINSQAVEPGSTEAEALGLRLNNKASDPIAISYGHLRNRGYEVLYHRTWTQPLTSRSQAQPLRIRAGELLTLPPQVRVTNQSAAQASQMDKDGAAQAADAARPLRVYPLDGTITLDIARYLHLRTELYYTQPNPSAQQAASYLTVDMRQSRRMRGGELHYLDHPLFGLLIKLTAVKKPSKTSE